MLELNLPRFDPTRTPRPTEEVDMEAFALICRALIETPKEDVVRLRENLIAMYDYLFPPHDDKS